LNSVIQKISNAYIYSNFNISFSAAAYVLTTYLVFFNDEINFKIIVLVFSSTFCSYALHRVYPILKNKTINNSNIILWTKNHLSIIIFFMMVCAFASAITFFKLNLEGKLLLIFLAFTTLLYSLPLYKSKRLKDYPFTKVFLIGITWGLVCSVLPLISSNNLFANNLLVLTFLEKCFFIIAITLPFDIRDLKFDKIENVKTIPYLIGVSNTVILSQVLLLISLLIVMFFYQLSVFQILVYIIIYLLTFFLVRNANNKQSDKYYFLYLDGLMILLAVGLAFQKLIL